MNVRFTMDIVLISQNKGISRMFERVAILGACDIICHFPEF